MMRGDAEQHMKPGLDETPERRSRAQGDHVRSTIGVLVLVVLLMVALSVIVTGCSDDDEGGDSPGKAIAQTQQGAAVGSTNTVTVIGKATVSSSPDEAVLTLSVENEGADAAAALDANSQITQSLVGRLKQEGVEDSALETSNVSVYPIRTYDPDTGKESLTGYRAQNTVTVTLKDALMVGKVLAAAVEGGATNVAGPEWRLSDDSPAVTDALKNAVADARGKAEAVASAGGVNLGDVITMNEGGVEVPIVPIYRQAEDTAAAGGVTEPPISVGTIDVTATITVTYSVRR